MVYIYEYMFIRRICLHDETESLIERMLDPDGIWDG
jgi:hypothetical protein